MAEISVEKIADEMYAILAEAAGKKNLNANDLIKLMQAKFGPTCSKDECKKAIRILIESQKCVYCFLGGVNYIQVAKKDAAAGN